MHPTRMAALAAANNVIQSVQAGMVRSADEMEGVPDDIPPAKRQKVAKLPGGQLYSEDDWIAMHPVRWHLRFNNTFLTTHINYLASHLSSYSNAQRYVET